jgi:hypothetical protein
MSIVPEDPQFLSNNDEWLSEANSRRQAALAQSAEHSPCKREVAGSIPAGSTTELFSEEWWKEVRECEDMIIKDREKNLATRPSGIPTDSTTELFSEEWCKLPLEEKLEQIKNANPNDEFKVKNLSEICRQHHHFLRSALQRSENLYVTQTNNALVAQRSEQDAHNVLVEGSNPSEGTIFLPEESLTITDHEERAAVYEQALREIISITRVESPMDRSAESFFFVASKMRKLAIEAMKRTGARS